MDVSAARAADGRLWLALVNLHPDEPARVATGIDGEASGRLLAGPELDTHNTFDQPDNLQPTRYRGIRDQGRLVFELPPRSVAVVELKAAGD